MKKRLLRTAAEIYDWQAEEDKEKEQKERFPILYPEGNNWDEKINYILDNLGTKYSRETIEKLLTNTPRELHNKLAYRILITQPAAEQSENLFKYLVASLTEKNWDDLWRSFANPRYNKLFVKICNNCAQYIPYSVLESFERHLVKNFSRLKNDLKNKYKEAFLNAYNVNTNFNASNEIFDLLENF